MKKLIIVGGGVAGLTAGIYALDAGMSCTLIEKNRSGAGALCGWRRGGYEIDGCLHWLTGTREGTQLNEIWKKTGVLDGGSVRTGAFFTSVTEGGSATFYDDPERTMEELISTCPEDEREIKKLFRAFAAASSLSGTEGEGSMKKGESCLALAPYALIGAGELAQRFKSGIMRRAICDMTGRYYSSLGIIFAYAAYSRGNGYLPRGGSRGAAERMIEKFKANGGEYISGRRAVRIARRRGEMEVTLSDGSFVNGDRVLCCTDPVRASTCLFEEDHLPGSFIGKLRKKEKYPLFSSVHFAFSAKSESVPFRGTVFFPCRRHSIGSVNRGRMMLREFSHEPSFAPDGMSVLQTMIFTDEGKSREWIELKRRGKEYAEAKERAASEVVSRISEHYPTLSGIKLLDSWTPATFSRYLGSICGSYMSFALAPAVRPASFPTVLPHLDGVYFASGWTRSPGGVPNAAAAGRSAALKIAEDMG